MPYTITKDFTFSASHVLDRLPISHPCGRLHRHAYTVRVELTGLLDRRGFVVDYGELDPFQRWIETTAEGRHLNDVMPGDANPTAENLSRFLTSVLLATVKLPVSVLARVHVSETPETWAVWSP